MKSGPKVYITGTGVISSLGNTVEDMFKGLLEGKTGVRVMPDWHNYKGLNSFVAAPAMSYDSKTVPRQSRRSMSAMAEMATLATAQALGQADLQPQNLSSPRVLFIMGSTTGSPDTMETYFRKLFEKNGPEGQMSTSFFKIMNHSVAANVAAALNFRGALMSPSCACATSTQAMVIGWELIRAGLYDIVVTGGADELHYTSTSVFDVVMAASRHFNDRPDETPRPFDRRRDGLVVSEGAGVVILESEDSVKKRNVRPLAEVAGGCYLVDGSHMSQSSYEGMVSVMAAALEKSGVKAADIGYASAHATGTVQGDGEEAKALAKILGPDVPVSSLKAHLGHSLAACGALEVIACLKMFETETLIPTRNLEEVDPECAGILHCKTLLNRKVDSMLTNNFAFGGMNVSLVLKRVE